MPDDTNSADDASRYAPGNFGCHEALHMALVFAAMVERELAEHSAVTANPEWKGLADRAVEALNDLYQAIGAQHVQEPAHTATGVRSKALTVGKPTQ